MWVEDVRSTRRRWRVASGDPVDLVEDRVVRLRDRCLQAQSRLHETVNPKREVASMRLEIVRRLVPAFILLATLCLLLAA